MSGCFYDGRLFPDESDICAKGQQFHCDGNKWEAYGGCYGGETNVNADVEPPVPNDTSPGIAQGVGTNNSPDFCLYNTRRYSDGADISLDGQRYTCNKNKWRASGGWE